VELGAPGRPKREELICAIATDKKGSEPVRPVYKDIERGARKQGGGARPAEKDKRQAGKRRKNICGGTVKKQSLAMEVFPQKRGERDGR